MSARYFGASVTRLEDSRLVQGQGRYVDDISPPGVLHAAFVRSQFAHAKVGAIDVSAARAVDGVVDVLTMADFAALASGPVPPLAPHPLLKTPITAPPLAVDEVRHVGETIAMVIATSRAIAEDAAALVMVDLEELPAIADISEALKPGAPLAHLDRDSNLAATLKASFGDVDKVFAQADHVVSETIHTHRGGCHSMETRGVLAIPATQDAPVTVYTSSQSPYLARRVMAAYLKMDERDLRVVAPDVGGGFGPKANVYAEEYAITLAAIKVGRPIKWIEDRQEHFVATTQQRDQIWHVDVAFRKDGKMQGLRAKALHDNGAYAPYGLILPGNALTCFPGPYALEAVDVTLDVVLTNIVPTSPVRGASRPNVAFVLERMADRVALELNIPREDVRRASFVRADQMPYATGGRARDGSLISYDSGDYQKALDLALQSIDAAGFEARRQASLAKGKLRGLGMASCVEDTGLGPFEGASVRVTPLGKVSVATGASSQGQGHRTVFSQIVADALGVDLQDITVDAADTDKFALGISTIASRIAVTAGSSVQMAATQVRDKALKFAAQKLEASIEDLELVNGAVQVKGSDLKVTLADIAKTLAGNPGVPLPPGQSPDLAATAYFETNELTFAYGSNTCEVEIDPDTGDIRIERYVVVHDCGRLINPLIVDGQIRGGVVHGIGNALFERMIHDAQGQPLTTTYGDYLLPMSSEMPNIEIHHLETPTPRNPLGVKGAGEGGTIPAAACVISAVQDALGYGPVPFVGQQPISPEQVVGWLSH